MKKILVLMTLTASLFAFGPPTASVSATPSASAQDEPFTPKPGSADREGICEAVRIKLNRNRKFVVHYLQVKNGFAFFRGNEVVPVKGGTKETDFQVMALLYQEQRAGETFWFVAESCVLDNQALYNDFKSQCKKRVADDGVPMDIFPAGIVD